NQNRPRTPSTCVSGQLLIMHPLTRPVWLGGLYFYLCTQRGRPYRALGFAYLIIFALLIILKGKIYYLAPAYPWLFAGGACAWEQTIPPLRRPWLRPVTVALLIGGGIIIAPLRSPVLPVETYRAC